MRKELKTKVRIPWTNSKCLGGLSCFGPILHSAPRFARLVLANDKGRDMAKRKIRELTTGVVVETDKE